ncbi:MAG: MarR family transcriptional regulator [Methanotrichaceae archaeon]
MTGYTIIIKKGRENYSAYTPEFPGIVAIGETEAEVTELQMKGIESWQQELMEGDDADWRLYELIDQSPSQTIDSLAEAMSWSSSETSAAVRRLEEEGLVRTVKDEQNIPVIKPVEWWEFFTKEELDEFMKPEFWDNVDAIMKAAEEEERQQVIVAQKKVTDDGEIIEVEPAREI